MFQYKRNEGPFKGQRFPLRHGDIVVTLYDQYLVTTKRDFNSKENVFLLLSLMRAAEERESPSLHATVYNHVVIQEPILFSEKNVAEPTWSYVEKVLKVDEYDLILSEKK